MPRNVACRLNNRIQCIVRRPPTETGQLARRLAVRRRLESIVVAVATGVGELLARVGDDVIAPARQLFAAVAAVDRFEAPSCMCIKKKSGAPSTLRIEAS